MKREDKIKEWLTGIMIGLILTLLMTIKAFAAVNGPEDAERMAAELYLKENAVEIPEDVTFWAEYYGERYDICPETIEAVCWVESRCQNTAQDPSKACKGLMQIKPSCHSDRMARLGVQNIFDIAGNIEVGTDYLSSDSYWGWLNIMSEDGDTITQMDNPDFPYSGEGPDKNMRIIFARFEGDNKYRFVGIYKFEKRISNGEIFIRIGTKLDTKTMKIVE